MNADQTTDLLAEFVIAEFHKAERLAWAQQPDALRGPEPEVNEDDCAMLGASAEDLLAWCDDLEARCNMDVTEMRAAVLDYIIVREGDTNDPDTNAHRAEIIARFTATN